VRLSTVTDVPTCRESFAMLFSSLPLSAIQLVQ
jgi:hypothetical protein